MTWTRTQAEAGDGTDQVLRLDALVVGAGFSGLYALKKLREDGVRVQLVEAGDGVGGTWFHNRYPGARCDIESLDYSYSHDEDLQQEWEWSERYAGQPELLAYLEHVAERFDLMRDIQLGTRVTAMAWDEAGLEWKVILSNGDRVYCRYAVMATGVLSVPREPTLSGLADFEGEWYHSGDWPHEGVDLTGKRVVVVGTGSSAVQMIPILAEQAAELVVLQRTANFTMPAHNRPADPAETAECKATYPERRRRARTTYAGSSQPAFPFRGRDLDSDERAEQLEHRWQLGGLHMQRAFLDIMRDEVVNEEAAEYVRGKIRETVSDPETAELLTPRGFPLATKRLCSGTGFYETFNRDDVTLIDVRVDPVERATPRGVALATREVEADVIVFATGFHAMTGALERIDPVGVDGLHLRDHWRNGPRTSLGVQVAGFPNLFVLAGPGSPSVISNMVCSIEQHVEWVAGAIGHLESNGGGVLAATAEAEAEWVDHVNAEAAGTLFSHGPAGWYYAPSDQQGRVFMPYVGGVGPYGERLDEVASTGYPGFDVRLGTHRQPDRPLDGLGQHDLSDHDLTGSETP